MLYPAFEVYFLAVSNFLGAYQFNFAGYTEKHRHRTNLYP